MKGLLKYLKDYKVESVLGPLFKMLEASFELFVPHGKLGPKSTDSSQ